MLLLIKKDLVIHKLSWFLYFAMLIFFISFNKDLLFVIALMSAIVMMNTFYFDELANGHKLWNSLPFTRKEIVSARYSTLFVVTLIMAFIVLAVEGAIHGGLASSAWEEVIGSFVIMMISASVFFPIIYKFSQRNIIFTFVIAYILFVIAGVYALFYSYLHLTNTTSIIQTIGVGLFWSILALGSLVGYFISWSISLKIYKSKELF